VSPQGGTAQQITRDRATYAKESVDGRYLYFAKSVGGVVSLWRVGTSGGDEVKVVEQMAHWGNFALVQEGIYFEAAPPAAPLGLRSLFAPLGRGSSIAFLSFAGGQTSTVLKLTQYGGHGLDVSPDGRTLLFGQMDGFSEDLLLVENVR
jgi:hypothetical protein